MPSECASKFNRLARENPTSSLLVALGVGLVFVFFAATGGDHSYVVPLFVMGTSLLVVGVLELVRRTWVAPT